MNKKNIYKGGFENISMCSKFHKPLPIIDQFTFKII